MKVRNQPGVGWRTSHETRHPFGQFVAQVPGNLLAGGEDAELTHGAKR